MKGALGVVAAIVAVCALGFFGAYYGLGMKRYFAPKHAEVNRDVFEQTPSFVHGKAQYIERLRLQYESADTDASKESLRRLILSEASQVDNQLLPAGTRRFVESL